MNKLPIFFILLFLPILSLLVSCKDDEDPVEVQEPTITTVSPDEGTPGTPFTISGTNLASVTEVRFGNTDAPGFDPDNNTATTVSASVPANAAPGETTITISSPGGSATVTFTVLEEGGGGGPIPIISGIIPGEAAPGTEITIEGSNFTGATAVNFGEEEVASEDFVVAEDGNSITLNVPENMAEGDVNITVVTPEGESAEFAFNVLAVPEAPSITAIIPAEGVMAGEEVTIEGTNLTGATQIMFGDEEIAAEDFTVADDGTSITFTVPADMPAGEVMVTVTAAGGTSEAFAYQVITEATDAVVFDPTSGPVGTEVTITGADFTGAQSVSIGDLEITDIAVAEDGSITFAIPDGAARGLISVNFADDQLVSTEEFNVTVEGEAVNQNGGLESAEVGVIGEGEGQVTAPAWAFSGNDGTLATFEVVDDPTQEGNRALAANVITLGENAYSIEARQEGITVSPNTTYTYSVWTRGPVGTSADFTVGLPDFSELGRQTAEMSGDWQEVSFEFTTGAEDTEIRLPIHFSKAGNEGQTIYIDNLQVRPVE